MDANISLMHWPTFHHFPHNRLKYLLHLQFNRAFKACITFAITFCFQARHSCDSPNMVLLYSCSLPLPYFQLLPITSANSGLRVGGPLKNPVPKSRSCRLSVLPPNMNWYNRYDKIFRKLSSLRSVTPRT